MRRRRVWTCPCGAFRVVAGRRANEAVIDAALGAHFKECPVAQADAMLRQAVEGKG